jgi:hypothetical protein
MHLSTTEGMKLLTYRLPCTVDPRQLPSIWKWGGAAYSCHIHALLKIAHNLRDACLEVSPSRI